MRGLVISWILIGSLGYFVLPWYVTGDGFFSIEWLLYYSFEDYGSAVAAAFANKQYWLLPIVIPLLLPLFAFNAKQNTQFYSNLFIYSGILGFAYLFLQGFSIGIRGWNFEVFLSLFGEVERQYGMGIGAVLTCSAFVFYITHGLAARGWLNGDNFIVGSIGSIIILVSLFVFFPIFRMFSFAFKSSGGGYELINFSNKFMNKGIWGLDCVVSNYGCGVVWNTLTMGMLSAFSSTILGLGFALLIVRTNFKFKRAIRILSVLPIITPPFVIGLAIIILFGRSGAVSSFLEWAFHIEPSRWIYGLPGIWFAQTLAFTPISFLVLIGVVESYIKKGTKLYLEGSLQTRKWTDDKGVEKYTTEIVIQGYGCRIDILSAKGSNQELTEEPKNLKNDDSSKKSIDAKENKEKDIDDKSDNLNDEDIPF